MPSYSIRRSTEHNARCLRRLPPFSAEGGVLSNSAGNIRKMFNQAVFFGNQSMKSKLYKEKESAICTTNERFFLIILIIFLLLGSFSGQIVDIGLRKYYNDGKPKVSLKSAWHRMSGRIRFLRDVTLFFPGFAHILPKEEKTQ